MRTQFQVKSMRLLTAFCLSLLLNPYVVTAELDQRHETSSRAGLRSASLTMPLFLLPWDRRENGSISWTSGPHSWSQGGQLTGRISANRGNGLDFGKGGATFTVTNMASGILVKNQCGFPGLGCIVAIKHDIGGTIMIYAHLRPNSHETAPANGLKMNQWYSQGTAIGYAGQSGSQPSIHLHIELRDGGICDAPPSRIDGAVNGDDCDSSSGTRSIGFAGSPVGWDGRQFVNGYYINAYFDYENNCGPGADCDTSFNYDGSAVKGSVGAPFLGFPYNDNGTFRTVEAFVHPDFIAANKCNLNTSPPQQTARSTQQTQLLRVTEISLVVEVGFSIRQTQNRFRHRQVTVRHPSFLACSGLAHRPPWSLPLGAR